MSNLDTVEQKKIKGKAKTSRPKEEVVEKKETILEALEERSAFKDQNEWGFKLKTESVEFRRIEVHPNFRNCRTNSSKNIEELEKSIEESGILTQPTVWKVKVDNPVDKPWGSVKELFFVICGFRRIEALQNIIRRNPESYNEEFKIEVRLFEGNHEDALKLNFLENLQREGLTTIEIVQTCEHLMKELGVTQAELGQVLGRSQAWVSSARSFMQNATIELQGIARAELVPYTTAQKISKLEPKKQVKLVDKFLKGLSGDDESKKKAKDDLDGEAKKISKKNVRPAGQIQKKYEAYAEFDVSGLDEAQKAYVYGIQAALYWSLNNELDDPGWTEIEPIHGKIENMESLKAPTS